MSESQFRLKAIGISGLVFVLTSVLLSFYTKGDQTHYIRFYENLQEYESIFEGFIFYRGVLSSSEPVYYLLARLFSYFCVPKIIFISLFNTALAYFTLVLMKQWKMSLWISGSFVLSNFYYFVLYTSAERLKFGVLFFVIALFFYNKKNKKCFTLNSVLAFFSHGQTIALFAVLAFPTFYKSLKRLFGKLVIPKYLLYLAPILLICFCVMYEHLLIKISIYYHTSFGYSGAFSFLRMFVFLGLSVLYSKKKKQTVLLFIPLFAAIPIVGELRLNIFGYFLFVYHGAQVKNGMNFGILITHLYFAKQSLFYILRVFSTGNGF